MKALILLIFIEIPHIIFAQSPIIEWQKSIGGSSKDIADKIIITADGGFVITGSSQSNNFDIPSNVGQNDIFVCKVDRFGEILWKKSFGGIGEDLVTGIIEVDNGFIVCGTSIGGNNDFFNSYGHTDIVLLKLNQNGELIWKKNFGGSENDYVTEIIKTEDDKLILIGYTQSNDFDISGNIGNLDGLMMKFDLNGVIIWQKLFGGISNDYFHSVGQTADNGFIVVGASESSAWGNYGMNDAWIIKINQNGFFEWQNHFGGTANDRFLSVIQLNDGKYVATGETYSYDYDSIENHGVSLNRDCFVVKIANDGQKEWSKCFGGSSEDDGRSLVQSTDNNLVILCQIHSNDGDIYPAMNGEADYWLIKLDNNGTILWKRAYGGSGHEVSRCLLQTSDNGFIFIGDSYSPDSGDVTGNHGDDDIWVAKLTAQENCYPVLNLDKTIYQENKTFQSFTILNSRSKIINSSSNIQYKAQKSIILTNGFEVKQGNVFRAEIGACEN
ncbi:MAG: 3-coathanger stack domain-containing protein [Spirosomataceae bacterium]